MKEINAFIELIENFQGVINVLGSDNKIYEIGELIKDFDNKKDFKALGVSYSRVGCFGQAYQGSFMAGSKSELKTSSDKKEILGWVLELLEKDGYICEHCDECGRHFTSGEGMFKYADVGYLCDGDGDCFRKKFPTDRDWHIYALEDWWKEYGGNEQWTEEELKKLSDEELDELMSEAFDNSEFPYFYTQA